MKKCGGTAYGKDSCNREYLGGMEGNSFSLRQHAADTAAEREPCMDETHVIGKSSRPIDYCPYVLPRQYDPQGSLARELAAVDAVTACSA